MAKRSVRKRRRMGAPNSHTPVDTPPESSILGCQQQGCPDLGLAVVEIPDLGPTYFCPRHAEQAHRELRKLKTIKAIKDWEDRALAPDPSRELLR